MSVGLYVGISIGTFVIIIVLRILVCMCKDEKKTDPQNRGAVVVITSANGVDQQNLHTTEACPAQLYVVGMSAPPGNSSYDNSSNNLSNNLPPTYFVAVSEQVVTTKVHKKNFAK